MRRRSLTVAVASIVVLAGCQAWPSGRFDTSNSGFNAAETKLGLSNVGALRVRFTADLGSMHGPAIEPVVSGGFVYVSTAGMVKVYKADGSAGCSGVPLTCQPVWTADVGGRTLFNAPTIANGTMFVSTMANSSSSPGNLLFAFDAAGRSGCSSTPVACTPLWTSPVGYAPSPTVSNGFVYVAQQKTMSVLDANGVENCSGTPKVCSPLWTSAPLTSGVSFGGFSAPTVGRATAYLIDYNGTVYAYDANGSTGCAGSPVVCSPKWTAVLSSPGSADFLGWVGPVLDGSRLLTYTSTFNTGTGLVDTVVSAFDADGVANCSGSPVACQPVWSTQIPAPPRNTKLAVAYGTVFAVTGGGPNSSDKVTAFATDGTGCSGTPMTCPIKWTSGQSGLLRGKYAYPIVANGVLYQATTNGLSAFDARGSTCTTIPSPTSCEQWHSLSASGNAAIADGRVFVISEYWMANPIPGTLLMLS